MTSKLMKRFRTTIKGNEEPIVRGIQRLNDADCIIGHNIIGYDVPVINKLYPWFDSPGIVVDTLILLAVYIIRT